MTFGKRDYIYLAILFIVIICATLVSIFVPRYYKLKYAGQQADSNSSNSTPAKPIAATGTDCNVSKVIVLLKDVSSYYGKHKVMLAADNTLLTTYTTDTENFNIAEQLASTILPILSDLKQNNNLTEAAIRADDFLFSQIDKLLTQLDILVLGK